MAGARSLDDELLLQQMQADAAAGTWQGVGAYGQQYGTIQPFAPPVPAAPPVAFAPPPPAMATSEAALALGPTDAPAQAGTAFDMQSAHPVAEAPRANFSAPPLQPGAPPGSAVTAPNSWGTAQVVAPNLGGQAPPVDLSGLTPQNVTLGDRLPRAPRAPTSGSSAADVQIALGLQAPPAPKPGAPPSQANPSALVPTPGQGGPSLPPGMTAGVPQQYEMNPALQQIMAQVGPARYAMAPGGIPNAKGWNDVQTRETAAFEAAAREAAQKGLSDNQLAREAAETKQTVDSGAYEKLQAQAAERRAQRLQMLERVEAAIQKDAEQRVNPDEFWGKMSTGDKVVAGLGVLFSAIGQGLTGGNQNVALSILNDRINKNIEAQKEQIARGNSRPTQLQQLYRAGLEEFGDEERATLLMRDGAYRIADNELARRAAEEKDPQVLAHIETSRAQLRQQQAENNYKLYRPPQRVQVGGMTLDQAFKANAAYNDYAKTGADIAKGQAAAAKDAREAAPQTLLYGGERVALRPEVGKEEAQKDRDTLAHIEQMNRLLKQRDELNTVANRASPEAMAKLTELNSAIAATNSQLNGMGVLSEGERKQKDEQLNSLLGGKGTSDALRANMEARARSIITQKGLGIQRQDGSIMRFQGQ